GVPDAHDDLSVGEKGENPGQLKQVSRHVVHPSALLLSPHLRFHEFGKHVAITLSRQQILGKSTIAKESLNACLLKPIVESFIIVPQFVDDALSRSDIALGVADLASVAVYVMHEVHRATGEHSRVAAKYSRGQGSPAPGHADYEYRRMSHW